jgi:ribosomal protein S3
MGQQANGVGLRYGVIDGWNSSWSINSSDKIEYRDLVQVSSDVEKLVGNLFKLNQGYIGKVGISKHAETEKVIIKVFGYVPSKYKLVEDRKNKQKSYSKKKERFISPKKQLRLKLYRLAQVLAMKYKYLGIKFAIKCVLVEEYEMIPTFKRRKRLSKKELKKQRKNQSFIYFNKRYRSFQVMGPNPKKKGRPINKHWLVPKLLPVSKEPKEGEKVKKNLGKKRWGAKPYSEYAAQRFFKRGSRKLPRDEKLQDRKLELPRILVRSRKKFGFLKRLNYYSTLMNLAYWAFKTKQPQFLAKFLAQEFNKTRYQRSLYNNVDKVCAFLFNEYSEIQGIRIQVSGRMNKSKRTRTFLVQYGAITTQTIIHPLKYAFEEAYTVYGSMGVKIWISY